MLTGELRNKIDAVWNAFWAGGIANPLEVIEQITYLLFMRGLDEAQQLAENRATRLDQPVAFWLRACLARHRTTSARSAAHATPFHCRNRSGSVAFARCTVPRLRMLPRRSRTGQRGVVSSVS